MPRRRPVSPDGPARVRGRLAAGLWLLLALWSAAARAAPTAADSAASAPPAAGGAHGFLWEARKADRHALLMGTLHVGLASDYPPDAATRRRLSAVDVIALEADISQLGGNAAELLARAQFAPGEAGLDTRIDARLKADTQRVLEQFGFPAEGAWQMKPWMLGDTLVVLQASKLGFSPAYATEAYLASLAAESGKPIAELEGLQAQFELLDAQPLSEQLDALRQIVQSILDGEAERELRSLVAAWRGSDSAAMLDYLQRVRNSPDPAERRQFARLISDRNATMANRIDQLLQDGRFYLVAVGSLHFFGSGGLVQELQARGYTVTPLQPQPAP
jgi:uncharacterized protein YbaP (TraB family)